MNVASVARHDLANVGALLGALVASKALAFAAVPGPVFAALPGLVDDVALALGLGCACRWLPRELGALVVTATIAWSVVAMLCVRALGVPLLPSMLRGVDPAMGDSFAPYFGVANAGAVAGVLAATVLGRAFGRRFPWRSAPLHGIAAVVVGLAMWLPASPQLAHRNALLAFANALRPRSLPATPASSDPSPVGRPAHERCIANGFAAGRSIVLVVLESATARAVWPTTGASAMPFLAGFAAQGVRCDAAWAVYPESIEGQVAILCGQPPRPDAEPGDYTDLALQALPRRLAPHGYRSALFHAGRFRFLGMQDVLAPLGFDLLADAATLGGERESSFGIDEETTVAALLRWVGAQPATQPVLACYLPIAGHHPYASPVAGPFAATDAAGCHRNALHHADTALRTLWRGLCALRPAGHWLVCIVGDHGQAFGEHAGNFGHSFELYEENLHVPLVFVAPGALAPRTIAAPCSHLDVVPALLDALGVAAGPSLLAGDAPCTVHAFTDWGDLLVAAREANWKLVHEVHGARDRLFDLAADPDERHDRATAEPARTAALRGKALAFLHGTRRIPPPPR